MKGLKRLMRNTKWKAALVVGVAAATVVGGVATASAADTKADNYVDGFDDLNDDWGEHDSEIGDLCADCENSTNTDLVMMWQSVLVADGHMKVTDIDGVFGADTAEATKSWESHAGVNDDGVVDDTNWSIADDRLEQAEDFVRYQGQGPKGSGSVTFDRGDDGVYTFRTVTSDEMESRENVSGAERIEFYDETIVLE